MSEAQETSASAARPGIPPEIEAASPLSTIAVNEGEFVRAQSQRDLNAKLEFASDHANYINAYIALADTKAAWVFAIPTATIAYLATQQEVWSLMTSPGHGCTKALAVISLIMLLVSAAASFAVIVPRLAGASNGIVYFGAVAGRQSSGAYLADLAPLSEAALADARIRHNFELARVCTRKYAALRVAMWSGLVALAASMAFFAVLKLSEPAADGGVFSGGLKRTAYTAGPAPRAVNRRVIAWFTIASASRNNGRAAEREL